MKKIVNREGKTTAKRLVQSFTVIPVSSRKTLKQRPVRSGRTKKKTKSARTHRLKPTRPVRSRKP